MWRYLAKGTLLLFFLVIIICIIYPLALWIIGQTVFPFQANGSLLPGPDGKPVGSMLIAQPFTNDEYFQPRPSAASYDASASASSALAASNYALRNRVAHSIGWLVKYRSGQKAGQPVSKDIEDWFQQDKFQGKAHIVAQWAILHKTLVQGWANASQIHSAYILNWAKDNPVLVGQFIKEHPSIRQPKASDLASLFFQNLSQKHPGYFPIDVTQTKVTGKTETTVALSSSGKEIESVFFDMWRQDHPTEDLQDIPADQVMTSASGLDPHISLENAQYQLNRIVSKWASKLKRNPQEIQREIERILQANTSSPLGGLAGEKIINVLLVNLELTKQFTHPSLRVP